MALPNDPWTRLYPLTSYQIFLGYSISGWRRCQTEISPLDSSTLPLLYRIILCWFLNFIGWFYVDFLTLVLIIFDLSWFFHTSLFLQCYVIVNHLPLDVTFAHNFIIFHINIIYKLLAAAMTVIPDRCFKTAKQLYSLE
jgi:hypothetical protein